MSNQRKIMQIRFDRVSLYKFGFDKKLLISILQLLPEGTTIVGWGEDFCTSQCIINIEHESFPAIPEASLLPTISCIFTQWYTQDGTPLEIKSELEWPKEYKTNHEHQYKTYQGFSKIEEICTVCGKTK